MENRLGGGLVIAAKGKGETLIGGDRIHIIGPDGLEAPVSRWFSSDR